jgi:hypothetical protein
MHYIRKVVVDGVIMITETYLGRIRDTLLSRLLFVHDNLFCLESFNSFSSRLFIPIDTQSGDNASYLSLSGSASISSPDVVTLLDVFVLLILDTFDGHDGV